MHWEIHPPEARKIARGQSRGQNPRPFWGIPRSSGDLFCDTSLLSTVYGYIIQVPVLKDGDFVLTESVAMLRYLAREKQVGLYLVHLVHLSLHGPDTSRSNYHSMSGQHLMTLGFGQVADHWYPKESQVQARVDEYLEWQHLGTRFISQCLTNT